MLIILLEINEFHMYMYVIVITIKINYFKLFTGA